MSAAIQICHDSDRDHWLQERMNGIGGSDAPQIKGLSNFGGPAKVAAVKLGYELGVEDDEPEILKWGRYVEAPMMQALTDETGIEAGTDGFMYRSQKPGREFMQATLDGRCVVDGTEGGVECKLAFYTADAWDEGVPAAVNCQVQHQMETVDLPFTLVLALLGGYRFRWARIDRDQNYIDTDLVPDLADFWGRVQSGESISPKGAPDAEYEALKVVFPDVVAGKVSKLQGSQWVDKFDEWQDRGKVSREAGKRQKELRNEFFAAVGNAEYGELDNGQLLTLRSQTRREHVVGESTFRVLRASKG